MQKLFLGFFKACIRVLMLYSSEFNENATILSIPFLYFFSNQHHQDHEQSKLYVLVFKTTNQIMDLFQSMAIRVPLHWKWSYRVRNWVSPQRMPDGSPRQQWRDTDEECEYQSLAEKEVLQAPLQNKNSEEKNLIPQEKPSICR